MGPRQKAAGADVRVTDPEGRAEGEALLPGADWIEDPYAAAVGADLVVIVTEWDLFQQLDLSRRAGSGAVPRIADLRNIYP